MTSTNRTPYDVFHEAIAAGIKPAIAACWFDFAHWEAARHFGDDPSHPAKAAVEWVCAMEDLWGGLEEFEGETKAACLAAMDTACEAFSKLEHSNESVHAIEKWKEYRLEP